MKKIIGLSILVSTSLFSAGYQIPNHSIDATALATANIANANGANAAYYNPANMVYNDSKNMLEVALSYVILEPIKYDSTDDNFHIKSKQIEAFIPAFHYVSDKVTDLGLRFGFSLVSPAGLTREWDDMPAMASSKKYSLKTLELNPSIAIAINSKLSFGLGLRYIKAEGEIELDAGNLYTMEMDGDGEAFGYNLALSYQATPALNISATYRSNITVTLDGHADATLATNPLSSSGSTEALIPANFILATAYTFTTNTTLEITYDRTMWSGVDETNFEFDNPMLEGTLGKSIAKNWHDTVAYRVGITQELDSLIAMCGFAYSTNAADEEYVSFSSPETDSLTFSLGAKYTMSDSFYIGVAGLYAKSEERTTSQPTNHLGVNGTLGSRNTYQFTLGGGYTF